MLNLAVVKTGLYVSATVDGIDHINDYKGERDFATIWRDLMESRSCNGGMSYASADDLGALSEAPCILEESDYADDGSVIPQGRLWYFPNYMTRDELQELADGKTVIFALLETKEALAQEYVEKIGYNPFKDDSTITRCEVRKTLIEYEVEKKWSQDNEN